MQLGGRAAAGWKSTSGRCRTFSGTFKGNGRRVRLRHRVTNAFADALAYVGVLRLFPRSAGVLHLFTGTAELPVSGMTPEQWETINHLRSQLKAQLARMQEGPTSENASVVKGTTGLDNLPLTVLSAGKPEPGVPEDVQRINIGLQAELARRSGYGKQVIIANSGHMIPFEAPKAVSSAIRDMIVQIREGVFQGARR